MKVHSRQVLYKKKVALGTHLTNNGASEPNYHSPTKCLAFDDKCPRIIEKSQEVCKIQHSVLLCSTGDDLRCLSVG